MINVSKSNEPEEVNAEQLAKIKSSVIDFNPFIHWLDDYNNYELQQSEAKCCLVRNAENIYTVISLIERRYKIEFIRLLEERELITLKQAGNLLASQWRSLERIKQKTLCLKYLKHADLKAFDEDNIVENYNSLPDEITIYRGIHGTNNNRAVKTFSWTIDLEKAEWFAKRYITLDETPTVYAAQIRKKHVFAYLKGREEEEILLDYTKLYNVVQIK